MLWWTLRQLKSTNWKIREKAAEKLGNSPDPRAIEALIVTLKDSDREVRKAAANALKSLGWEPADKTQRLHLAIAQQDWEELVKLGSIAVEPLLAIAFRYGTPAPVDALCKMGSVAVEPLIAALKDQEKNGQTVIVIAKVLGKIRDTRAVEPLLTLLKAEESDVRGAAAIALEQIGAPESEQSLAEYRREEARRKRLAEEEEKRRLEEEQKRLETENRDRVSELVKEFISLTKLGHLDNAMKIRDILRTFPVDIVYLVVSAAKLEHQVSNIGIASFTPSFFNSERAEQHKKDKARYEALLDVYDALLRDIIVPIKNYYVNQGLKYPIEY